MPNQNKISIILDALDELKEKLLSLPTNIVRMHVEVMV